MILAILLGMPLAAARRSGSGVLRFAGAGVSMLMRGIPPVVWILLIYYGFKLELFRDYPQGAAILALGIVTAAYVCDAIRAGLDSVPRGQGEAAKALALGWPSTMWQVILPQAFPIILSTTTAYSITLLKNSALASIVAVADLMFYAHAAVMRGMPPLATYFAAGAAYLLIALPLGFLVKWLEGRSVIAQVRS
ncbi:amino acid ABC transporter permease [Microbacterium suwonense]|uniref:amino acid ABC transporter permease n=1 Tax=Microbacterium suwonense TaxID=683047 RepID=UPI00257328CF|nr:amino acid ABC transporter permease [Microbacterium suwonense]